MKTFLIAAMFILPMTSFARTISFKCQSVDVAGLHKFDASGIINTDEYNRAEGFVSLMAQKAQSTESIQIFEELRVRGFIRHFEKGELGPNEFDQLVLETNEPYVKTLNLLLDFPGRLASKAISIDNFSYRSNCKITAY